MNPVTSFLVGVCLLASTGATYLGAPYVALFFFALGVLIALSLKMANAWEKGHVRQFVITSTPDSAKHKH